MENLREVVEFLIKEGRNDLQTIVVDGRTYSTDRLNLVEYKEPKATAIGLTTLTGLVDYIKAEVDELKGKTLLLQILGPSEVLLRSELRSDKERETYISCEAILPNNLSFNNFISSDMFNIMLQSSFVNNADKATILKVTGNIVEDAVKTIVDDGVSQMVTAKTGVATQGNVIAPSEVSLAPYRTFPEIKQPESTFVFRLKEGPKVALFEADGGYWRNEAMQSIKKFLQDNLSDFTNIKIIS